jgi:tetratricopeptide (TPR) repeat protein
MNEQAPRFDARFWFTKAYQLQMQGKLEDAVKFYKRSIEIEPSAEAYTFLGWTYSFLGRYEDAIAECKHAIEIDPDFGNAWNDIGAYMIELGQEDEAIPYLEKATLAKRYDSYCFPHFNLSRIFTRKGMLQRATEELKAALTANPDYLPAREALQEVETQLN